MDKVKRLEKLVYKVLQTQSMLEHCKQCEKQAKDLNEHDLIDLYDTCNDCSESFYEGEI